MAATEQSRDVDLEEPLGVYDDEHEHFSHRSPWLRAFVLGANDGLVSTASLMLGVGGGSGHTNAMILAGVAGLVGGALSMACGEYISVASQKDSEEADILKEIEQQRKGSNARRHELEELVQIYKNRGLQETTARQVALELTQFDVIRSHARDELNIDIDDLSNPLQAAVVSALAFSAGAGIPLLAGAFIDDGQVRIISVAIASALGLILFGTTGAWLGGAKKVKGAVRVLVGGILAMAVTYGVGRAFGTEFAG